MSVKESIVENHVKSSKHAKGKERMSKNEAQHKDLAEALQSPEIQ